MRNEIGEGLNQLAWHHAAAPRQNMRQVLRHAGRGNDQTHLLSSALLQRSLERRERKMRFAASRGADQQHGFGGFGARIAITESSPSSN
jgi:hypothetical protein